MKIKLLKAKSISDTRGDKTIEVQLKTEYGVFIASAPNGKSRGKYEAEPWKKSSNEDVKFVNAIKISEVKFDKFDDLALIEKIFRNKVGANTMIAIECAFLKALAKENKTEVWKLINPRAKNFPMPVGNAIGGGVHSPGKKPDFQEFHLIPNTDFEKAVKINKRGWENCSELLKNLDKNFTGKTNDENAWITEFDDNQVMEIIQDVKENMIEEFSTKIHCGIDVAASGLYKNNKYNYLNPKKSLSRSEQIKFMTEIADKFFYLEDPLEENDFSGFAELMKKAKGQGLIVGDDLTVTNLQRIDKAWKMRAINGVIIKPNQNGSLIEVKKIVEYCKSKGIKTIFSHRSGETSENILADLAFGFQADFIKTGITGKGRDEKLNRMIEIEKSLF
ncbi:MAG: hypothetical protein WC781_04855 [Candidatus Pacearchaeota archaeon]|jgi:enolase